MPSEGFWTYMTLLSFHKKLCPNENLRDFLFVLYYISIFALILEERTIIIVSWLGMDIRVYCHSERQLKYIIY